MKTFKLILMAMLLSIVTTQAQQFFNYFNEKPKRIDIGYSIYNRGVTTIAGSTKDEKGNVDALIIQRKDGIDASVIYGGLKDDEFRSLIYYPYGEDICYYFFGTTYSYGEGADNYLVATRIDGTEVFSKIYGTDKTDIGNCIKAIQTPLSTTLGKGLLLLGTTDKYGCSGNQNLSIIITDLNGEILQEKVVQFGANNIEGFYAEQYGGCYYITGVRYSSSQRHIIVMKLDINLNFLWRKNISKGTHLEGRCLKEDSDGNLIVAANLYYEGVHALIMRLNSATGDIMEEARISTDATSGILINNLLINGPGQNIRYVLSGKRIDAFGEEAILCGLYSFTNMAFGRIYKLAGIGSAYEICRNPKGGYYFTGYIDENKGNQKDVLFVGTDFIGDAGSTCDDILPLSINDPDLEIANIGLVTSPADFDEIEINSDMLIENVYKGECPAGKSGILDIDLNIMKESALRVHPSPASGQITFGCNDEYIGGMIQVIDVTGKIIYKAKIEKAQYNNISVENLSKGLYILRVSNDQKSETIKFQKE